VSLAVLMVPGAVLAQEERRFRGSGHCNDARSAGPRRPTRTAPARTTRQAQTPTPAPTPPPEPGLIDRDKVPSTTQTLTPVDLDASKAPTVPDALMRTVPSVFIGDTAVNPFQPDIQYRVLWRRHCGHATRIGGLSERRAPQRVLRRYGELGFHPERAIRRLDLFPSNPIFGLNAIGGAISLEMKTASTTTDVRSRASSLVRTAIGGRAVRRAERQCRVLRGR